LKNSMFTRLLIIVFIPLLITSITSIFIIKAVSDRALEEHFLEITRSRNLLLAKIISQVPDLVLRFGPNIFRRNIPYMENDFQLFIFNKRGELVYGDVSSREYQKLDGKLKELSKFDKRRIFKIERLYVDVIPLKIPTNRDISTLMVVFKYKSSKEFESAVLRDFPLILILLTILSVFIAIFMSYVFYLKFKNSLKDLMKFTRDIGNGNYNAEIPDEIFTDELVEFSQSLKILQSKLREQERIRKKISSEVSHELRTPIAIIRSQLEAICDGILPPDKERIENLIKQADKLSELVTTVRNLTELIATELKFESVNLGKILKELCESMKGLFEDKGIELICDNIKDVQIKGDSEKLVIAIRNILDNSLKYTQKGVVKISMSEDRENVIVTISDTGIGISAEDLPYVTERFYRANISVEGSGLGLSIVKEIMELHGGKLEIESELGKGTVVRLIFTKISGGDQ